MITLFILLTLAVLFTVIAKKTNYEVGLEIFSTISAGLFYFWALVHSICIFTADYDFEKLAVKRQSFVESLEYSRKNGKELESATILKEITDFNQQLASEKYDNNHWYLGQFIDDRIETLEPIK